MKHCEKIRKAVIRAAFAQMSQSAQIKLHSLYSWAVVGNEEHYYEWFFQPHLSPTQTLAEMTKQALRDRLSLYPFVWGDVGRGMFDYLQFSLTDENGETHLFTNLDELGRILGKWGEIPIYPSINHYFYYQDFVGIPQDFTLIDALLDSPVHQDFIKLAKKHAYNDFVLANNELWRLFYGDLPVTAAKLLGRAISKTLNNV